MTENWVDNVEGRAKQFYFVLQTCYGFHNEIDFGLFSKIVLCHD